MRTIWKFPLSNMGVEEIEMPKGAEILTVQIQDERPCLWAIVEDRAEKDRRFIETHGTGHPMRVDMGITRRYIGTVQQPPFVWHVFERIN